MGAHTTILESQLPAEDKICGLLRLTLREGMDGLIEYLTKFGFFNAPASTRFHGCFPGGLASHSLRVYELLSELHERFKFDTAHFPGQKPLPLAESNLIISALLHDVCKIGAYNGVEGAYSYNRANDKGHALLSISRIKKFIELTEIEEMLIKFHMGVYGLYEFDTRKGEYALRGAHALSKEQRYGQSLANVWNHNPVVKFMYFCDEISTIEDRPAKKEELVNG